MNRYFEIIMTGRQLAALVAGVALLVAVAFGLGVSVRLLQPPPPPSHEVIAMSPPPIVPAAPAASPPAPAATPTSEPTPTAPPTATPAQAPPVEKPKPQPIPAGTPQPTKAAGRWVQVAAFGKHDQADGVRNRVMALGYTAKQVVVQPAGGGKFRVRVGPFPDGESAGRVTARLRAEGFSGAFVVKPGE